MKIIDRESLKSIKGPRITGIGSLPHHNIDAALEYSFKFGIPFLPQIPIRNPWEYMIPQALEGLPGLQLEDEGSVLLNLEVWQSQSHLLNKRLEEAFRGSYEGLAPSASISSAWQPFLWELQERNIGFAKIQMAGPMTAQWALRIKDQSPPDRHPELCTQIFQLVLARCMAMVHQILECNIQPILFLDEPGLYALSLNNPKHVICLQELKVVIQTLRKQGAIVGLHCCSNTDWKAVLGLGIDILSIDTTLSLGHAFSAENGAALEDFIKSGGSLSLGIIPTARSSVLHSIDTEALVNQTLKYLSHYWESKPELVKSVLSEALYTPACGLALQSISDSELILEKLVEVYEYIALS